MKIVPQDHAPVINPAGARASDSTQSPRERAIAKLIHQESAQSPKEQAIANTQSHPVPNPTQVAPEEFTAVKSNKTASEGQPTTSESPAPQQSPKEETKVAKEETLSNQYAILARKEKAFRAKALAQDSAIKAREAAIAAKEAEYKAKESEYQTKYVSKDKVVSDPLTALLEMGITYDQITQLALNQSQYQQDPATKLAIQNLQAELKATREAQEQERLRQEDASKQQYQQALGQIRSETKKLVEIDPQFEMIKMTDSIEDVVNLIEETFKKDGELLSVEDAAIEVENYLVEEAEKLTRAKKIQSRLNPQPSKTSTVNTTEYKQSPSPKVDETPQLRTLSNAATASPPMNRVQRAIAAFNEGLKKR